MSFIASPYQREVQKFLASGESVILIAPCGAGKTFAIAGSGNGVLPDKLAYAVPLRALAGSIASEIRGYAASDPSRPRVAVHHGGKTDSELFGERAVVTTYDQIVCAAAGLPLSFATSAGHAVAGALQMSRLILDEVHLAFDISQDALSMLAAILEQRAVMGAQSVLSTATLPYPAAKALGEATGMRVVVASESEFPGDEALVERRTKRQVRASKLRIPKPSKSFVAPALVDRLSESAGQSEKSIYFSNTVGRLQATYDALIEAGVDRERITVLHNRMPAAWRADREREALERFGKHSGDGPWILLTNQVSEAGLDISAPLVATDPAPVQTLVQRLGRCARFFRGLYEGQRTEGEFLVLDPGSLEALKSYAPPYLPRAAEKALDKMPEGTDLDWDTERQWVEGAWLPDKSSGIEESVKAHLALTGDALNLMDAAFTERSPGRVERTFRDVVSVDVAVLDGDDPQEALEEVERRLQRSETPEGASMSIKAASKLRFDSSYTYTYSRVLREIDGEARMERVGNRLQPGDVLLLPPEGPAYLHADKGLVEVSKSAREMKGDTDSVAASVPWIGAASSKRGRKRSPNRYQSLEEHTSAVSKGVEKRLGRGGHYRPHLERILGALEPGIDPDYLADEVSELAALCADLHDLGKANRVWQVGARSTCEARGVVPSAGELVGRTPGSHGGRNSLGPHTPPVYSAAVKGCSLLMGGQLTPHMEEVVRVLALATARHHNGFHAPAAPPEGYSFEPESETSDWLAARLEARGAPSSESGTAAEEILRAARATPEQHEIPAIQPRSDLFALYTLVGRAILVSDREDAAGEALEDRPGAASSTAGEGSREEEI